MALRILRYRSTICGIILLQAEQHARQAAVDRAGTETKWADQLYS